MAVEAWDAQNISMPFISLFFLDNDNRVDVEKTEEASGLENLHKCEWDREKASLQLSLLCFLSLKLTLKKEWERERDLKKHNIMEEV